jgi:hypothetical protein
MSAIESDPEYASPAARAEGLPSEARKETARAPIYDRRLHARLLVAAGHPVAAVAALFGEDPAAISGGHSGGVNGQQQSL